jgi:hypothetical protein
VLISAWQDSSIVKLATTIHQGTKWVVREQKKPKNTSTSATITKVPFKAFPDPTAPKLVSVQKGRKRKDYDHRRQLPIPGIVDDYNHFMNGVDIADQLRAKFTTEQRVQRT